MFPMVYRIRPKLFRYGTMMRVPMQSLHVHSKIVDNEYAFVDRTQLERLEQDVVVLKKTLDSQNKAHGRRLLVVFGTIILGGLGLTFVYLRTLYFDTKLLEHSKRVDGKLLKLAQDMNKEVNAIRGDIATIKKDMGKIVEIVEALQ